jgi:hypothetical protein
MSLTRFAVNAIQMSATLAMLMAINTQIMELPIQSTRTPPSGNWSSEMKKAVANDGPAHAGAAMNPAARLATKRMDIPVPWSVVRVAMLGSE